MLVAENLVYLHLFVGGDFLRHGIQKQQAGQPSSKAVGFYVKMTGEMSKCERFKSSNFVVHEIFWMQMLII